ncbi:MAG: hypothetical protein ACE5GS_15980 [Kiloniellaceae bacterium]
MAGNEESAIPPPSAREVRRYLARLRALAARLDHQAALIRNGGFNPQAEAQAGNLADDAFAIRWALRRIAPETEAIGQLFAALHGAGRGP